MNDDCKRMKNISRLLSLLLIAGATAACDAGTGVQIPEGGAKLRIVNASPDAQMLQVKVGSRSFTTAAFPASTSYADAPTGVRQLQVSTSLSSAPLLTSTVGLQVDSRYTFVIMDRIQSLQGFLLTDDPGKAANGAARLRFVNAAQPAGSIDLFLTAPNADLQTATPSLTNLAVRQGSAYLDAAAGTYRLRATRSGTRTVILDVQTFSISAGQIRTALVIEAASGGAPYSVLLLQDQ